MLFDPALFCLNYLDYQRDILEILKRISGKLIVIGNADILLNDETRKYLSGWTESISDYRTKSKEPVYNKKLV